MNLFPGAEHDRSNFLEPASNGEGMMRNSSQARRVQNYIPILDWLPHYKGEWLRYDFIAALSVWALLVPQAIAYASIAGMPPEFGLYAAFGALLGYTLFGTAGQVVTGPSATVAAVSASVVALLASAGSDEWIANTAALAVTAALVYILLGLFRMGWISHFLSGAVLEGFVFGFGFGLIIEQSYKVLGVEKVEGSYFQALIGTIQELPETSIPTLIVGGSAIALLLLMRRFLSKWPRALIVVALGIVLSSLLNLESYGVEIVGVVPTGLPSFGWPRFPTGDLLTLLMGGLAVIFVGFSESLAAAKEEGSKHDYEIDTNQEMIAQGMANGASGLFGGFVVAGSLSKTTVADLAGQKSQMASLLNAGLILLTMLFLADFFTTLPKAVLGAVVIDAAIGLIKVEELRHYQLNRRDYAAFLAAAIGLFFTGVLGGILIGVILSLLLLIASASQSPVRRMGLDKENDVFVDTERHPEAETIPGIVVAEIHGPLFFADAENFRASVLDMVAMEEPHTLVIDLDAATTMDMDGAQMLGKLSERLNKKNVKVFLARVDSDEIELLRKIGVLDEIGPQNVYESVRAAVAAAQKVDKVSRSNATDSQTS